MEAGRARSKSPQRSLTPRQRARWRTLATRLERPLLQAIVAAPHEREGLVKRWALAQDASVAEDSKLLDAVADFLLGLRSALLQDLVGRYFRLMDRDTSRNSDIQKAARAFSDEFVMLLQEGDDDDSTL